MIIFHNLLSFQFDDTGFKSVESFSLGTLKVLELYFETAMVTGFSAGWDFTYKTRDQH